MESEQSGGYEIRRYLAVVWRWLWLVVLAAALAGGAAYLVSQRTTPIYEASTTLLINESEQVTGPSYSDLLMSERLARTYAQTLKARPLLDAAAAQLGVTLTGQDVAVEPVRDTQLIRLKARHADPAMAAAIANTLVRLFIEQNAALRAARVAGSQESLKQEMAVVQADIDATQRSLAAERARPTPDAGEVARLEGLLTQQRAVHSDLFVSYEQMRAAQAREADSLLVVEPAVAPLEPMLPRTLLNTLLAGLVGAMLATGAAFAVEYLDDTIKRPQDVERSAHLPTLATVSRFARPQLALARPLMAGRPNSEHAEAYRLLRTNLQFATLGRGSGAVTLLVTSAGPQEGKTTTLANLAIALAQIGKRVLLVDTDLRRPSLHSQFGLPNKAGLTTLLLEQAADPASVIHGTGVEGLGVLTSGPIPANPAEVLSFPQCARLLERLRSLADYVLLDAPPALGMADAGILAQRADGVLLVAEAGRTRSGALQNATLFLARARAHILGVVLNKASPRHQAYYARYSAEAAPQKVEPHQSPPRRKAQAADRRPGAPAAPASTGRRRKPHAASSAEALATVKPSQ